MIRSLALLTCLVAGLAAMHYRSPLFVALSTCVAFVLTTPLRRKAKHFDAAPKRKEGHV